MDSEQNLIGLSSIAFGFCSIGSIIELSYDLKCRQTTRNESLSDAWRAFLCYL